MFCDQDDVLLLDKRTQAIVENYIPDARVLDQLKTSSSCSQTAPG